MTTSKLGHQRTATLNCRISPEHKRLIETAAQEAGFSLSDYIVHTLVGAASAVVPRSFDARPKSELTQPAQQSTAVDQRESVPAQRDREDWRMW